MRRLRRSSIWLYVAAACSISLFAAQCFSVYLQFTDSLLWMDLKGSWILAAAHSLVYVFGECISVEYISLSGISEG